MRRRNHHFSEFSTQGCLTVMNFGEVRCHMCAYWGARSCPSPARAAPLGDKEAYLPVALKGCYHTRPECSRYAGGYEPDKYKTVTERQARDLLYKCLWCAGKDATDSRQKKIVTHTC